MQKILSCGRVSSYVSLRRVTPVSVTLILVRYIFNLRGANLVASGVRVVAFVIRGRRGRGVPEGGGVAWVVSRRQSRISGAVVLFDLVGGVAFRGSLDLGLLPLLRGVAGPLVLDLEPATS